MIIAVELFLALAAIAAGIALFVLGMRRRAAAHTFRNIDPSNDNVLMTNYFALAIIALLFFGVGFVADAFM